MTAESKYPTAPTLEELYAVYCETYAAVKSGQPTGFSSEGIDLGKSVAKMLGANAVATNSAPCTLGAFCKLIAAQLDADWATKRPYGPPR